jgi:hypothetical protein
MRMGGLGAAARTPSGPGSSGQAVSLTTSGWPVAECPAEALASKLPSGAKVVLITLWLRVKDTGATVFMSRSHLADAAGVSPRQLRRTLSVLSRGGWIVRVGGGWDLRVPASLQDPSFADLLRQLADRIEAADG